jgi:hypothetical protein
VCPSNGPAMMSSVAASQMRIALSPNPETPCLPSGENTTEVTVCVPFEWASYDASSLSVPDANCFVPQSRNNVFAVWGKHNRSDPFCPSNGPAMMSPVSASQMRIVLSHDPETTRLLTCENAMEVTSFVCPPNGPATMSPVRAS